MGYDHGSAKQPSEVGDKLQQKSQPEAAHIPQTTSVDPLKNPSGHVLQLQRSIGNQAVQRLLTQRKPRAIQRMPLSPKGAHAAQLGGPERQTLLTNLINGTENIGDYTTGVCYDTVAFAMYLRGLIPANQLLGTTGQAWLPTFDFANRTQWTGGAIPPGSAVGFRRVGNYQPGFFHAALGTGGTNIRAVNGNLLGAGWQEVDIATVLQATATPGTYTYDNQPIEVWYW